MSASVDNGESGDLDNYKCPICLEIYEKPQQIFCGHIFCQSCLHTLRDKDCDTNQMPCPVCRQPFHLDEAVTADHVIQAIRVSSGVCFGCSVKVPLVKLRYHNSTCSALAEKVKACALPDKKSDVETDSSTVNRHTFECPYCSLQNFDATALMLHCNKYHSNEAGTHVVCPICASMPWGDPNLRSVGFIAHLNKRHQFDYNNVVDFNLDDDQALEKALKASLEEQ